MRLLWQDVVFGLRMLRRSPGLTLVAVMALTLGIGANATVFTIANAYLFKNLPFADSERVLYVSSANNKTGRGRGVSYPDYRDFEQAKAFKSVGAFTRAEIDLSDNNGFPMPYRAARVTANAFSILGLKPLAGRDFLAEDTRPNAPLVAIVSHSLWTTRYGQKHSIIGSSIRINGSPAVVIGVLAPGVRFPSNSSLWMPLLPSADWERRESRSLTMFGRLVPRASLASARAELGTIAAMLERQYPETNKDTGVLVRTYNDHFTGRNTRLMLLALLGAVAFVLLIACANVANLLLARAVGRSREISIRIALGAGRGPIFRQLLVESVMLSGVGGILGAFVGQWGVRIFELILIAEDRPAYLAFTMDYRVLAFLTAITLGTGILFGLAPALRLSKVDVNEGLKDGGRLASTVWRGRRLASGLVVAEMALAFVLLVGAGLMIRSLLYMTGAPIGARTDHVMSMAVILRAAKYPTEAIQLAFHQQLKTRLEAVPGIETIALASNLLGDGWINLTYELEGAAQIDPRRPPRTGGVVVSPDYFAALEIRPVRGRVLVELDGGPGSRAVVVNQSFAKASWPGEDALEKRLRLIMRTPGNAVLSPPASQPWLTVVGVIPDVVQNDEDQGAHDPLIYLPYRYLPQREMVVAARTRIPPKRVAIDFRREVQAIDPDLAVIDVRTLDELLRERTWTWRVYCGMFSIFAGIALVLASVGLYAVVAHSVGLRTPEIGVRIAMGASRRNILAIVLGQIMRQLCFGLLAGLAASFAVTGILSSVLVGVRPIDAVTFALVGLMLTVAGLLGSAIPALRAARVDPVIALRHE